MCRCRCNESHILHTTATVTTITTVCVCTVFVHRSVVHIKRCEILHTRIHPGLYLIQTATSSSQQNNHSNNSDVIKIIMNLLKTDLDDDVDDGVSEKRKRNDKNRCLIPFERCDLTEKCMREHTSRLTNESSGIKMWRWRRKRNYGI